MSLNTCLNHVLTLVAGAAMSLSFIGICVSVITSDAQSAMVCGLVFGFSTWAGALLTEG